MVKGITHAVHGPTITNIRFFPRTIKDWNSLPVSVIDSENINTLSVELRGVSILD